MAAALRSSAVVALRRAAAAPAPAPASSSSRLPSACRNAYANTRVRTMHYGNYDGSRSMFDAEAYSSPRGLVPAKQSDKYDGIFGFAAAVGAFAFICAVDGDLFWWGRCTSKQQPRMNSGRRRR